MMIVVAMVTAMMALLLRLSLMLRVLMIKMAMAARQDINRVVMYEVVCSADDCDGNDEYDDDDACDLGKTDVTLMGAATATTMITQMMFNVIVLLSFKYNHCTHVLQNEPQLGLFDLALQSQGLVPPLPMPMRSGQQPGGVFSTSEPQLGHQRQQHTQNKTKKAQGETSATVHLFTFAQELCPECQRPCL